MNFYSGPSKDFAAIKRLKHLWFALSLCSKAFSFRPLNHDVFVFELNLELICEKIEWTSSHLKLANTCDITKTYHIVTITARVHGDRHHTVNCPYSLHTNKTWSEGLRTENLK